MRETLRLERNKIKCFPRNQSLSDLLGERTVGIKFQAILTKREVKMAGYWPGYF